MKLMTGLRSEYILPDLQATTKKEVLAEISATLSGHSAHFDGAGTLKALLERESLGSTGIGDGIAIPHGTIRGLDEILISFGRSKKGIDFNALDGKPVHLLFLLLVPENYPGQHLKILAKLSRMLKDADFRKKLREAENRDELHKVIGEKMMKYDYFSGTVSSDSLNVR